MFKKENQLYCEANNTCHKCRKSCVNKIRDHCDETGKYRGSKFNICNLKYRQQNFIPAVYQNGKGYDFKPLINELFKQNGAKRRVDVLPSTNGKARMFGVGILKFIDSYSFMTPSLDKMDTVSGIESKTLYPNEYFKNENSYDNKLGNLSIEDFRSSQTSKLLLQAEVDEFNKINSKKTSEESTLGNMENNVSIIKN